MNDLKLLLMKNKITIKSLAKKLNISPYRLGKHINSYNLSLKEIKLILTELNMKFEDVF